MMIQEFSKEDELLVQHFDLEASQVPLPQHSKQILTFVHVPDMPSKIYRTPHSARSILQDLANCLWAAASSRIALSRFV